MEKREIASEIVINLSFTHTQNVVNDEKDRKSNHVFFFTKLEL